MNQQAVSFVEDQLVSVKNHPNFKAGDTVTVNYRIVEEKKERIQKFKGLVIKKQSKGGSKTFTVRKVSDNIAIERIFPLHSPFIDDIEVHKIGKVRRAKLYYLRGRMGKALRIKEKIGSSKSRASVKDKK